MTLFDAMTTARSKITLLEKKCTEFGFRKTRLLKIVLEILVTTHDHLTIAQIHSMACGTEDNFALASLYRMVNRMVDHGLLECHQFRTTQAYFKLKGNEPHDHLIDIETGRVIEFRSSALDKLKAEIAQQHGYRMDDCHIEFYAYPMDSHSSRLE